MEQLSWMMGKERLNFNLKRSQKAGLIYQVRTFNSLNNHFFINNVGLMNQTPTAKVTRCGFDLSSPYITQPLFVFLNISSYSILVGFG